jgi:hypothetical protein
MKPIIQEPLRFGCPPYPRSLLRFGPDPDRKFDEDLEAAARLGRMIREMLASQRTPLWFWETKNGSR